jgi:hypothetical protein
VPGKRADFAIWPVDDVASSGSWDKLAALVLAPPAGPRDVFVEGRAIVREGDLVLTSRREVVAGAQTALARLMAASAPDIRDEERQNRWRAMHDLTGWSKGPRLGRPILGPARGLTLEQRRDPAYVPPLPMAIALGVQHVLAMFVSNITPRSLSRRRRVRVRLGRSFGADLHDPGCHALCRGGHFAANRRAWSHRARLPLVQGTSFAFISVMIPIVAGKGVEGMAALTTAAFLAGLLHAGLSRLVGPIRFALPPLVTGLVVLMIGLSLVRVGIEHAAGGRAARASGVWFTRKLGFGGRGRGNDAGAQVLRARVFSTAAVLLGLLVGYGAAWSWARSISRRWGRRTG